MDNSGMGFGSDPYDDGEVNAKELKVYEATIKKSVGEPEVIECVGMNVSNGAVVLYGFYGGNIADGPFGDGVKLDGHIKKIININTITDVDFEIERVVSYHPDDDVEIDV